MGCCCCVDENEPELPEGIEPCCNIRGPRCMSVPYKDKFLQFAQFIPIFTIIPSLLTVPTTLVSLLGLIVFQFPWFCRQNWVTIYVSVVVAVACSMSSMGFGIYAYLYFFDAQRCDFWPLERWGDTNEYQSDSCPDSFFVMTCLFISVLWAFAAGCMFHFVKSGRHAKWEKYHTNKARRDNGELGDVELGPPPNADTETIATADHQEASENFSVQGG